MELTEEQKEFREATIEMTKAIVLFSKAIVRFSKAKDNISKVKLLELSKELEKDKDFLAAMEQSEGMLN